TARISPSRTPSETPLSPGEPSACRNCSPRAQSTSLSGGATMAYTSVRIGNAVRGSWFSLVRGNEGRADRSLGTLGRRRLHAAQHAAPGRRFSLERAAPGPVLIIQEEDRNLGRTTASEPGPGPGEASGAGSGPG